MVPPFKNTSLLNFNDETTATHMRKALESVEAQFGCAYPLIIGGKRYETGDLLHSVNPSNYKEVVGSVHRADSELADKALDEAWKAFASWGRMPAEQRARSELRTLATAVESYYIHNSNTLPSALSSLTSATPRIVTTIPDDPFRSGSTDYSYARDSNAVYYVIYSYGRDRAADITGMDTDGTMAGTNDDDIFVTNGTGTF